MLLHSVNLESVYHPIFLRAVLGSLHLHFEVAMGSVLSEAVVDFAFYFPG